MSAHTLTSVLEKYEAAMIRHGGVVWGSFDCLHMAVEATAAAGRSDLSGELPVYFSEFTAARALARMHFASLRDALDRFGKRVAPGSARPGDIAWMIESDGEALGVVIGAEAAFLHPQGLLRRAVSSLEVWRLG